MKLLRFEMADNKDIRGARKDPTEDPVFKRIVKHFLNAPPEPRVKKSVTESGEKKKQGGRPVKKDRPEGS